MKITEFFYKYDFHDSLIENIIHDCEENIVTFRISFCNWMQDEYRPHEPEIVDMKVCFHHVQHFVFEQSEIKLDDDQILDVKIKEFANNFCEVQFIIHGEDLVRIIMIHSDCVEHSCSV